MRSIFKTILTVSSFCLLAAAPAQASVFVWQSEDGMVSASFSDSWGLVHNQSPSGLMTIKAPGDHDYATCQVNASDDGRFKVYPVHYAPNIQRLHVSKGMWEGHFARESSVTFHKVLDNAGLSDGFASMASVSFETANGPKMMKRALAFASLQGDTLYTVECSAEEHAYHKWHNAFLSFVKSVEFKRTTNHALTGYYRDFLADSEIKIKGQTILEDTYH